MDDYRLRVRTDIKVTPYQRKALLDYLRCSGAPADKMRREVEAWVNDIIHRELETIEEHAPYD